MEQASSIPQMKNKNIIIELLLWEKLFQLLDLLQKNNMYSMKFLFQKKGAGLLRIKMNTRYKDYKLTKKHRNSTKENHALTCHVLVWSPQTTQMIQKEHNSFLTFASPSTINSSQRSNYRQASALICFSK